MSKPRKAIFDRIYSKHDWGGNSLSGPGSDPNNTAAYIHFVNNWLESHQNLRHVVELGCGDWATSRLLYFGRNRTYLGIDIVPNIIKINHERYGSASVRFQCCDFLDQKLSSGDLLIVKDVLQHLSNAGVMYFLDRVLPLYRYALITNDMAKFEEDFLFGFWRKRRALAEQNVDIVDGFSRPVKLAESPFNLNVVKKSHYPVVLQTTPRRIVYIKEILVWRNLKINN